MCKKLLVVLSFVTLLASVACSKDGPAMPMGPNPGPSQVQVFSSTSKFTPGYVSAYELPPMQASGMMSAQTFGGEPDEVELGLYGSLADWQCHFLSRGVCPEPIAVGKPDGGQRKTFSIHVDQGGKYVLVTTNKSSREFTISVTATLVRD